MNIHDIVERSERNEAREAAGFVRCDRRDCRAVAEPSTRQELVDTLEHWREHPYLYGCSHGR